MMKILRNNLLKNIFGLTLLLVLALKVCAFSISCFKPSSCSYSIEKDLEENKDKEEEALDKTKKKLLLFESSIIDQQHPLWTNRLPKQTHTYRLIIDNHPPKNVSTPPPDFC